MKKTVSVVLAIAFLLGLGVSGALAYQFDDSTLVQEWRAGAEYGSGAWKDVIGDAAVYNTFGADLIGNVLTIYTNWDHVNMDQQDPTVATADLFIDVGCNGSWDYAIVLDTNRSDFETAYEGPFTDAQLQTSNELFQGQTSLIYGGKYDQADPKMAPALATSDDQDTVDVTWGTVDSINTVAIDLSNLDLTQTWGFYWGTGTCSNDGFSDCVPIPPSVLLMGSGLLGVGLLGWRRRGSEDQVG